MTTIEATTVHPVVQFSKWTPRAKALTAVVAVMKTVDEDCYVDEDGEVIDPDTYVPTIRLLKSSLRQYLVGRPQARSLVLHAFG